MKSAGGSPRDPCGQTPSPQLTKARIVLVADASEARQGWSDSQIAPEGEFEDDLGSLSGWFAG
jgi:hypothetical protein